MSEQHVLVDFKITELWLFHGPYQAKQARPAQIDAVVTQLENERVVWVVGDAVIYPGTPAQ